MRDLESRIRTVVGSVCFFGMISAIAHSNIEWFVSLGLLSSIIGIHAVIFDARS